MVTFHAPVFRIAVLLFPSLSAHFFADHSAREGSALSMDNISSFVVMGFSPLVSAILDEVLWCSRLIAASSNWPAV